MHQVFAASVVVSSILVRDDEALARTIDHRCLSGLLDDHVACRGKHDLFLLQVVEPRLQTKLCPKVRVTALHHLRA